MHAMAISLFFSMCIGTIDSSALFSMDKKIGIRIMNIIKNGATLTDIRLFMKLFESIWFNPYAKNIASKVRIMIPK